MTQNALLGFGNYVDDGEVTPAGGACYPTLPLANLKTRQYGEVARYVSADPNVTYLTFQWPQRRLVRVVAYGPHNVGLRGKVRLRLSNSPDLSDPVYDSGQVLVWPRVYDFGDIPWGSPNWWTGQYTEAQIAGLQRPMIFILPAAVTFRYGRLDIEDPDNAAGYVQSGRLFVANAVQPRRSFVYGGELGLADLSETQRALSGARFFTERARYRVASLEWNTLTGDEAMAGFFDLQLAMGLTGECLFVWDPDDTKHALRRQFFCTLGSLGRLRVTAPDIWGTPVELEELL